MGGLEIQKSKFQIYRLKNYTGQAILYTRRNSPKPFFGNKMLKELEQIFTYYYFSWAKRAI